ncbi:MAG TPA: glycosyltransferase [Lysobacter sp.]|nr:glycosyltransferase [Lysobacter sp.]
MTDERAALLGLGIVYFGNDWHAENRTSSHHIAVRLAQSMPVLYVDSPGMRAPGASGRDLKKAFRKIGASLRPPVRIDGNLWHCTVPQLPFRRVPGVEAFNRLFSRWALRRAMRHSGIRRCISWFVVPHPGFMARRLGEKLCVYYCVDDYASLPGVDAEAIARRDLALTRCADLVFVAPPALVEAKRAQNERTFFSPHGVDAALFARAHQPDTPIPDAARELVRPVVGYFGSIHEWIDIELIAWLAMQRPQWSFLLVGYAATDVAALRALANVHLVGPQPYPTLPNWAKSFDVAMIPSRLNRFVANSNPLKLREYLATGKPVVSVRSPEIERFARLVNIADSREQFLAALDRCMAGEPADAAATRMAAVADQTWDRRVEEVLATVARALPEPMPPVLAAEAAT